jgi:ABC-2 type transport system permease protein
LVRSKLLDCIHEEEFSINAASLLSFWIILIIVLPALLNNFIINRYPLPEALDTVIEQREVIMQNGIQIKKQLWKSSINIILSFLLLDIKESFNWLWYYAMQQMGDDESKAQSDQLVHKL